MFDSGNSGNGFFYGWFSFGHITLMSCLFIIYMRIAAFSNTFSFSFIISLLTAALMFLILWIAESSISGSKLYQSFFEIFQKPHIYIHFTALFGLALIQYLVIKIDFYLPLKEISDSTTSDQAFDLVASHSHSGNDSDRGIKDSLMGSSSSGR